MSRRLGMVMIPTPAGPFYVRPDAVLAVRERFGGSPEVLVGGEWIRVRDAGTVEDLMELLEAGLESENGKALRQLSQELVQLIVAGES